jgi:hypothetical protein
LHKVTKIIAQESPDIPLFTIHDSVVTTEDYADHVHNRMLAIIESELGLKPQIKKEPFCEKESTN